MNSLFSRRFHATDEIAEHRIRMNRSLIFYEIIFITFFRFSE